MIITCRKWTFHKATSMMRLGQEHKSLGPILNRLLTQAVSTGKRVRSETNLGTGAVSISSAAVDESAITGCNLDFVDPGPP